MQEIRRTQGLVKLSIQMRLRNSTYYEGRREIVLGGIGGYVLGDVGVVLDLERVSGYCD